MKTLIATFALGILFSPIAALANEANINHEIGTVDIDTQPRASTKAKFFQPHTAESTLPNENLLSNQSTVVPETTSIALGLLGLLLILRRRK